MRAHSPCGHLERPARADGRAPALHLAGRGPGLGQRLAHHPAAVAVGHGDEGVGRRGVVGEPPWPERHLGPDRAGAPPPSIVARRAAAARSRAGRGVGHRPPRPIRRPRRSSASPCTGTGGPAAPGRRRPGRRRARPRPQRGEPHDDARRAEPALAGTGGAEGVGPAPASAASSPSSVVTAPPRTRRAGVTQATRGSPSTSTVQQPHWPWGLQPSLAERTPSRSRSTSSSDAAVVGHLDRRPVELEADPSAGLIHLARIGVRPSTGVNTPAQRRQCPSKWSEAESPFDLTPVPGG